MCVATGEIGRYHIAEDLKSRLLNLQYLVGINSFWIQDDKIRSSASLGANSSPSGKRQQSLYGVI